MLRRLLFLPRHPFGAGAPLPLPADRRRVFCRFRGPGTGPTASSPGSTAARPSRLTALAPSAAAGGEKRTSTGGFHEIPDDDRGGPGAGRHSERDFAFG